MELLGAGMGRQNTVCRCFLLRTLPLLILFFTFFNHSSDSLADVGLEVRQFYKCYHQLTGMSLKFDNLTLQKVKANEVSSTEACQSVLRLAKFNHFGETLSENNIDGIRVLNQFHKVHQSWLLFGDIPNNSNSKSYLSTLDSFDPLNGSLYFTTSLFQKNFPFKNVVLGKKVLKSIRTNGSSEKGPVSGDLIKDHLYSKKSCSDGRCLELFEQTGFIVGVKEIEAKKIKYEEPRGKEERSINLFESFGGGVLGSQEYILSSLIENYGFRSDGVVEIPRIWAAAVVRDFLCRSLPSVKKDHIEEPPVNSYAIRSSKRCLTCHRTMDSLAGTLRNIYYGISPVDKYRDQFTSKTNAPFNIQSTFPTKKNSSYWATTSEENFFQQHPMGQLHYLNSDKKLTSESLTDIESLGRVLSSQPDFYRCIVARYYEYFIGVPAVEIIFGKKSKTSNEHSKVIKVLADELEEHQSLFKTIESILNSDAYQG